MKNNTLRWIAVVNSGESPNINRNVFVSSQLYDTWMTIKNEYIGNYYKTNLIRAIYSLATTPGGRSLSTKNLEIDGAKINYLITPQGDVRIHFLAVTSDNTLDNTDQSSGLYRVRIDRITQEWTTDSRRLRLMDYNHRWNNAHYAAVSGSFDDKEEAGRLLIKHIVPAYKAALNPKDLNIGNKHYSLFWQNRDHSTKSNSRKLAALIQQAQANNATINWLVHGEGAGTFAQALQHLIEQPSVSRLVAMQNTLENQSVFFSNPRGKNTKEEKLKELCEAAGIRWLGSKHNRMDLKNPDARQAAIDGAMVVGSKFTVGGGITGGLLAATGFDKVEKAIASVHKTVDLLSPNLAANIAIISGFGLLGYIVGKDAKKHTSSYIRNVFGVKENTWGNGHKHWAG
ncbi:hypothetical protein [Microbulbifer sp. DLAB2-AA]|uniref:hypothetical protein n=1 Tax=Microbulbifer sp. DLAB2-AA TaxID=3243394 RepID=UPI0040394693